MYTSPTADFITTSLNGSITSSDTSAVISAGLDLPATNGVLQIDYDDSSGAGVGADYGPETIAYATYDDTTGDLSGLTRGIAGTTAVAHDNAAPVQCASSSAYLYLTDLKKIIEETAWEDWTPTKANMVGTLNYAKYIQIGKTVFWRLKVTLTAGPSGEMHFSPPVAINTGYYATFSVPMGWVSFCDAGSAYYEGAVVLIGTDLYLKAKDASGTYLSNNVAISSSVPFSWTSGDAVVAQGFYEAE